MSEKTEKLAQKWCERIERDDTVSALPRQDYIDFMNDLSSLLDDSANAAEEDEEAGR